MSGYPGWPGGYQQPPPTSTPAMPPGGPPAGQFLAAIQAITTALNKQAQGLNTVGAALGGIAGLTPTNFTQLQISETAAPAPPASGAILYVDSSTKSLTVVKADGSRHTLA